MSKYSIEPKNGWHQYEETEWPALAIAFAEKHDIFRYNPGVLGLFYKGETPETATDWIIITDDGGFYKVGAEWMIWSNDYCVASWSAEHVIKTANDIIEGREPVRDPEYQT